MSGTLLVVNPRAGGGRTGATFPEMKPAIESALGPVDVVFTERPGHGIDLAREAVDAGRELVVAVGGDGTFSEVVGGVAGSKARATTSTRVGLIAQGTGGDFRKTLGIEHRLKDYLDAMASGRERAIDVARARFRGHSGKMEERYFVNILSAGTSGLVCQYVATASRALGGTAAYFTSSLRALARCRRGRLRCEVTLDGETDERRAEAFLIAVCNGRFFGAGMQVAPMARVDDGRLEVVMMSAPSKLAYALVGQKMYTGRHVDRPGVEHFGCQKIRIDLEGEEARDVFLLELDGEPLGALPIEIEIVPAAVTLRV